MLARELGMTVRELLTRIDSRELTEWQAFLLLEQEDIEWEQKKSRHKNSVN